MEISIEELRKLCKERKFKWTVHVIQRLQARGIEPADIRNCILTGEIIEQYPSDNPYPSCLMLGNTVSGRPLHVVVGLGDGMLWLVTAYYPNLEKWERDLKTRREPKR